jgi:predicted acetyltransferase
MLSPGAPIADWHAMRSGRMRSQDTWTAASPRLGAVRGSGSTMTSEIAEIAVRFCTLDDWPAYVETMASAFGSDMSDESRTAWERIIELSRMIDESRMTVAIDQQDGCEAVVGTAGWLPFDMTVPGGEVPVAAVTMVTVRPTHRRRGILRQLMRQQLDDLHARGIAVATLWASEAPIYQRFGYGLAFIRARVEIDSRRATFLGNPAPVGRTRFVDADQALERLPDVYERARRAIPASFRRTAHWWRERTLNPPPPSQTVRGATHRVVLEIDGRAEGYALYRTVPDWGPDALPTGVLEVMEAVGTTPMATREIWRYLFSVDLVATVRTHLLCADHPLFLSLADPRQLRMSVADGTWVRLVEVARALEARRYADAGSLTFELSDPFCTWNEGTWTLEAGPASASVRRGSASSELRLSAAELSAMYLGTVPCSSLVRAGRVDELVAGAASRADALFRSDVPPWCLDDF